MDWQAWFTAVVLVLMLGGLASGRFGADLVLMGAITLLLAVGIVTPREAIAGFANPGVATIALLYVVAAGLQETGALTLLTERLLGRPKSAFGAQVRLIGPVAVMSAFMNNTPLVAMFVPVVRELSKRTGVPVSQLLMPLSFAAILGGVCTLIGTSTNLVVRSLIIKHNEETPDAPIASIGMWTLALVGVPILLAGLAYILVFGRRLLPGREASAPAQAQPRQYMTAMRVAAGSPIIGKTIEAAGLRRLPGLFLSRIERHGQSIVAVGPEETLMAADTLFFVGVLDSVVDLQKIKGLEPAADEAGPGPHRPSMRLIEAVISPASPLVGRTIREAEIRTHYGAVVIAVHRHGHRMAGKIGDITMRAGDTLLLEAPPGFRQRHRHSPEFYLVSELEGAAAPRHERAWVAIGVLALLVVGLSLERYVDTMVVAIVCAGLMVTLRCCTGPQARAAVEWPVLIVIGSSFGVAKAMEKTGLAETIANTVVASAGAAGPWALLAVVYALTLGFTTVISNNAAAALMFPIALGVAQSADLSFLPFAVCICVAASCEFMTPIGYQTNLMVMGPGGYKWLDYTRFGAPLTLLAGVMCVTLTPLFYGFR